jgi:hypothetical protein
MTTDWMNRVRLPAEVKYFSNRLRVQRSYDAHPASYQMGSLRHFPGGKARQGRDADHSPHILERSKIRSYTSSPPWRLHGAVVQLYFTFTE